MAVLERSAKLHLQQLPGRLGLALLCALTGLAPGRSAAADEQVEFDPAFLRGGAQVDVSRFSRGNPVLPGDYQVDININGKWSGHAAVRFVAQPNSDIAQPCIDRTIIARIGLDFEKLNEPARKLLADAGVSGCVGLGRLIPEAAVTFDLSRLRLDISVPQAAVINKPRGYVSPEFWDSGVTAATLGYNLNGYRSALSYFTVSDAHLDLSMGLNWGSWHLRQRASAGIASGESATYQEIATYLTHDLPSIRSDLIIGDSFTDGAVFDSFGYRGASLASNDQMLPDSQLQYAPVVRGIARTNARVVITQGGNVILETTVSPGPFEISDLYATGYGGDLHVTVYEADGGQDSFTVPYASLVQLLRPGVWRYTAVAGEVNQPSTPGSEHFVQATLQHGFSSLVTGYSGTVLAPHYSAGLLGIAVNTKAGAVAFDVTEATAGIASTYYKGQSYRLSFSKLFSDTHTNLTLSSYRYSSSGYYSFSEQQSADQASHVSASSATSQSGTGASDGDLTGGESESNGSAASAATTTASHSSVQRPRSQWLININQTLPGRWGNFYLTASLLDYWYTAGMTTQFQTGYTNHFKLLGAGVSYSFSASRQDNVLTGKPDNELQANFSIPLGRSQHSPLMSTNFTQDSSGGERTRGSQQMINGTLGENSKLSYSASASETNSGNSYTVSGAYQSRYTSVSASYGEGNGFNQQSLGTTGGLVLHPGGVTFANQMTDTIGIVEAIGAEGARVTNSVGTTIDSKGYAVLPFLLPYRMNAVNIDPDETISSDVEFKSTSESVAPRLNSVVMIRFQTVSGRAVLMVARLPDGSVVPFGASVVDTQGSEVGLSGQDGGIYLRGIADSGSLTARWGDAPDERCSFQYQLPPRHKDDPPILRFNVLCKADPLPESRSGNGANAPETTTGYPQ